MTYRSASQRRHTEARKGWAMIAGCALVLGAMIAGAYHLDQSRGVSASQSLASEGL